MRYDIYVNKSYTPGLNNKRWKDRRVYQWCDFRR